MAYIGMEKYHPIPEFLPRAFVLQPLVTQNDGSSYRPMMPVMCRGPGHFLRVLSMQVTVIVM